jgi:glycosyltransferase involved in cell wall biosynthesis
MRIALDGLHLFGNYSGVHTALASLVEALRRQESGDEHVLFVPRDFQGPPKNDKDPGLIIRKTWFKGRWRSIRTIWRNLRLLNRAYKEMCDLLHGPVYALPAACSMPSVVTIHDVIALTHPLFCTPGSARIQKRQLPRSCKIARRVIVPSEAVKTELLRNVRTVNVNNIDVIPWGVDPVFRPLSEDDRAFMRRKLNMPEQYVLFVGNMEPKKNIVNLIRGFMAAKMNRKFPHKLVIAGQRGWGMPHLEKDIRNVGAREDVYFTGYIPQAVLPALYAMADLFVLPSLVEGFGMPVLEAMASGCPVLISSDAALQEVAGGAAHVLPYVDQKPLQPMREAFEQYLMDDPEARKILAAKGLRRAKQFTWARTAELTRQTYIKALG